MTADRLVAWLGGGVAQEHGRLGVAGGSLVVFVGGDVGVEIHGLVGHVVMLMLMAVLECCSHVVNIAMGLLY